MFLDENPEHVGIRVPPEIVIKNHEIAERDFVYLYGSLRPLWGKLYSMALWRKKDVIAPYTGEINNGFDTYQVLKLFNNCANVACVAQPLHYYRVRSASDYNKSIHVRRYLEGVVLFNVALEAAQAYHIDTFAVQQFLMMVYYSHVKDLMDLAVLSGALTPSQKIEFISYALSEILFYRCAVLYPDRIDALIKQSVTKVLSNLDALERAKLKRYFLIRLLDGGADTFASNSKEIWLFSALCDPDNKFHWGSNQYGDINSSRAKAVIEIINAPLNNEHILAKQELQNAAQNGDYELAFEKLKFLTSSVPLDRDTLYYEMVLSLIRGNYVHAVETAEIARVFWREDEKITSMILTVYEKADSKKEKGGVHDAFT